MPFKKIYFSKKAEPPPLARGVHRVVRNHIERLTATNGTPPSDEELGRLLGLRPDHVARLRREAEQMR